MESHYDNGPIFISENEVKKFLSWPTLFEACEQALRSVCKTKMTESQPDAIQPARQRLILNGGGVVFSMLGVINNYRLPSVDQIRTFHTIGHKMVTYFESNQRIDPPIPNILASILLFDTVTGKLQSIVEGTEITTWRTAACSLVATKYLYYDRIDDPTADRELAVLGCGVQGRIHAIGMCSTFNISAIHLWNRTKAKAVALAEELEESKSSFRNKSLRISIHDTVDDCVAQSDIIVTVTTADAPILFNDTLKPNVHINAVGAGVNHHSEIDRGVYEHSQIYVDCWAGAESELKTLNHPIVGEVGEVINGIIKKPTRSPTIFHSMGMAVEDAAVAQLIIELYARDRVTQATASTST